MHRMYYHRFSGLRSCCIISSFPILVIFIFPVFSPSSPRFLFFFLPFSLFIPQFSFFSFRYTVTGFVKGKTPSLVVVLLSFPFLPMSPPSLSLFLDSFFLALSCIITLPAGV
ncbi:hypothetical protein BDR06DRAFT_340965 [Suillus hirtellus]|nr:hypothetical protein BDR06DRAFT_340965 [Suillus hirtellus]